MYKKILKRLFDIALSLFAIILFSPIMLVVALLVKIDSNGPVLFVQDRVGKNKQIFKIYKFRTMVVNAVNIGDGLFVKGGDSRITRVGNVLRKTSLDELPQLFNILKGDMSIVGPRPPVTSFPYDVKNYPDHWDERFSVKPGVTGLAQINGRANISWDEKLVFDNEYIKRITFVNDIRIIILTVWKTVRRSDIYKE